MCDGLPAPIVDIDLSMPPRERWRRCGPDLGELVAGLMQDVFDAVRDAINEAGGWPLHWLGKSIRGMDRLLGWLASRIAGLFGQDYVAEIEGLAKACEQPTGRLFLGNLLYDLTQAYSNGLIGSLLGCSSYSVDIPGQGPTLVRTLDWDIPERIGRYTISVRFNRGREQYISIGFAGLVGVVSAMRPGRWAVTLNQAPMCGARISKTQFPALQLLRWACDGAQTFGDLVRRIRHYRSMSPFLAHVVGTQPDHQAVIEHRGVENHIRRIDGEALICTNHYVLADEDDDGPGATGRCDRYQKLRERTLERRPLDITQALELMRCEEVVYDSTEQLMAFCPRQNDMVVHVRRGRVI